MSRHDAFFFDFDGVLADTEPVHYRVWREILLPLGIDLTWDYYACECIGVTDSAMLAKLGQLADPPKPIDELLRVYPLKRQRFHDVCAAEPPITPDTIAAILALHGRKIAVVTSSRRFEVQSILLQANLLDSITACVFGDETTNHKPLPEPYLKAVERTGARRPLVFEDSVAGLQSARAAGLEVVHVRHASELPALLRAALDNGA